MSATCDGDLTRNPSGTEFQKIAAEIPDGNGVYQKKIPLYRKICYAVGGAPYQLTANIKGFFLQIFLLDVVQMDAAFVSLTIFLGRAWDAISDPLVGYMVTKSGRTRFGKLIPWIVLSTPFGVVSYIMLWYTPQNITHSSFSFAWYFTWCCLFDTFMSCYHVPYSSLNMFLGGDQKERDSATGFRMGAEMLGTLLAVAMQGQIVGVYHAMKARSCSLNLTEQNLTSPDMLQKTRTAYVTAAGIIGVFYFLCSLVLFLGVKEKLAPLSSLDRLRMPFMSGMKMVARHSSYIKLVFGFLFASVAFQLSQSNLALFYTHVSGLGGQFQHLVLILLTSATLSISMWQMVLVKIGKKPVIFIGLTVYIPTLTALVLMSNNFIVHVMLAILAGSSLASLFLVPWSMLPDVVDDFKVKNPTYRDLEPLFYSCFVFFNKFGGGVSIGISALALHFAGYKPGACTHNEAVTTTLRVLSAPVPIILVLLGMLIFYFYPINESRRQEIQRELDKAWKDNSSTAGDGVCLHSHHNLSKEDSSVQG